MQSNEKIKRINVLIGLRVASYSMKRRHDDTTTQQHKYYEL